MDYEYFIQYKKLHTEYKIASLKCIGINNINLACKPVAYLGNSSQYVHIMNFMQTTKTNRLIWC